MLHESWNVTWIRKTEGKEGHSIHLPCIGKRFCITAYAWVGNWASLHSSDIFCSDGCPPGDLCHTLAHSESGIWGSSYIWRGERWEAGKYYLWVTSIRAALREICVTLQRTPKVSSGGVTPLKYADGGQWHFLCTLIFWRSRLHCATFHGDWGKPVLHSGAPLTNLIPNAWKAEQLTVDTCKASGHSSDTVWESGVLCSYCTLVWRVYEGGVARGSLGRVSEIGAAGCHLGRYKFIINCLFKRKV